ncbi:MAG: DUF4412 domain-containing protein [Archangium sp.]|nr:DUF4412 domain-containing protein [Archangium sp.]
MRLVLTAVLYLSSIALADLTLVNETVAMGKTRTVTLSAKGAKAFFEMKEPDAPNRTMMRDGEQKKLFIIDHPKKTVLVITEQDSKELEEKQAVLRAQLQAQLAKLPPEQRARMESGLLAQVDPKPIAFAYEKKKTPPRKVAGYACQDYTIKRDGLPSGEGCFASWKDLGMSADEFKSVMLKAMPAQMNPMGTAAFEASDTAPGYPVWRTHVNAQGQVTSEVTLKSFSKTAVAAANFELPKDYAQKSMAESMRPPAK